MTQHQWVELKITPVTASVVDDTNDIKIEVTDIAEQIADEDTAYVCWHCKVNLDTETIATECEPS